MEWKNDGVMYDKSGEKMKWEIMRIESVKCKNDKILKMTEVKTTKIIKKNWKGKK